MQFTCLDSRAQTAEVELKQTEAYCRFVDIESEFENNSNNFRFGSKCLEVLGSMNLRNHILSNMIISEQTYFEMEKV